jgi:N-sulfoglucosamine sulfohydrolase
VLASATVILSLISFPACGVFDQARPNILYVVIEDSSREDYGVYGAHLPTPEIDRLAEQGMRFSNAWVASTNCSPSRGAFYTGQYAHRNGLLGLSNLGWSLPAKTRTIVDELNDLGYETVLCGKQHERVRSPAEVADGRSRGSLHRFDRSICEAGSPLPGLSHSGISNGVHQLRAFLDQRGPDPPPFFIVLAPHEAHGIWDTPETKYAQPALSEIVLPPYLPVLDWLKEPYQWYMGAVHHADRKIGELIEHLDGLGLAEETVVIVTSDHGAAFRRAKGTLYEAGIGVPLVIRWSSRIAPGGVSNALVNNIDLAPTLIELAGGRAPADADGRSYRTLLLGGDYEPARYVFSERNFHEVFRPMRAVRDSRYKLIANFSGEPDRAGWKQLSRARNWKQFAFGTAPERRMPMFELYDLESDPQEHENLAGRRELSEVQERLRDELYSWMNESDDIMKGAAGKVFWPARAARKLGE